MDNSKWVRSSDGNTMVNMSNAVSVVPNSTDPNAYDVSLVTGQSATIAKHVALGSLPTLPLPPPLVMPVAQEGPYQQSDVNWLLDQQRRVGRVIDVTKE